MPRRSIGDLAGEICRAGGCTLLAPPPHLGREGARLWRGVIASRAPGHFNPAALILLELFCANATAARAAARRMNATEVGTAEYRRALNAYCKLALAACSLGVKLRLTPSSSRRADAARTDERGVLTDGLLGGEAARGRKKMN